MSGDREKKNITAKILVVEDSQVQAEALKHILEENGYTVSLAYNGMEGVGKLDNSSFSLIISDIMMPVMDGYEFCSKVKSDGRYRDIPVMLLTELSDPEDIIKGLQCGADNFLTKPYSDENLLKRIKHLMINRELRKNGSGELAMGIFFRGENYIINSDKQQILDLLISVFETAIEKNRELVISHDSQQTLIEMLTAKNDELARSYTELEEIRNTLDERVMSRTADRDKQIARHLMTIEALRLSEEKYRMLTERMTDILWTIDNNLNLTYISPAVEKILGFTPEERMLQTIDDMLTPESSALVQRILKDESEKEERGADPGRIFSPELSLYHKNGTVRIFENSITFIRDREGKPAGFQGMSRDITEPKEMAKLLCDREERFKSILEALNDWVWEVDCSGHYTYSSPRSSSLLGYDPDEIIGKTPFDLMLPDEAARVKILFGGTAAEARPFNGLEIKNIRKNGEIIVLETSGSPFFGENGELLGYRGVDRDITKRKEFESIIEKSTLRESTLNRICQIFLTLQDESVYKEVLNVILNISGSRDGFFGYIDEKNVLIIASFLGEIMNECLIENKTYFFPPDTWGESMWGRAIREKKILFSNTSLSGLPENHTKIYNNISIPVISREKVIGIINISNRETDYTDDTVSLIEEIALFISPVLNARIERDRKETERQQYEDELLKHQLHLEELVTARTGDLVNERDRIDAIIKSVSDGIIVTDMQQRVILMNHSAEELLGICFQS
ncbi:MAG TPA: PAS domain S-box protein, partial [Bacteroidales bacterium]|nr:PAS domain S-box protein [Bacteroidales bacterium]